MQRRVLARSFLQAAQKRFSKHALILSCLFSGLMMRKCHRKTMCAPSPQFPKSYNPLASFQNFSDELFEEALKNKHDVIVFIEPDRFRESFQQEVGALLEKLVSVRQMTQKKRQLTVFLINQVTPEIQKQFQDKYNSDIETDSILMLRNKYIQSFYSFTPEDYFENKEYLLKYFAKINKLSEKNFDKMQDILKFLPASNTIILLYSKKGSKDERNFKRRFNIIQTQPHYSKNSNIHWMLIDDFTAQKLKIENPIEGQMYFLFKTSKLNNYKQSVELNGRNYYVTEASALNERRIDAVIQNNSEKYNRANVFAAKCFEPLNPEFSIILEVDLNRLNSKEYKNIIQLSKTFAQFRDKFREKHPDLDKKIVFVNISKSLENGEKFSILIRDDLKTMHRIQAHSMTKQEDVKQLKIFNEFYQPHSYFYLFPKDQKITDENLLQFFQDVKNEKIPEHFKSQQQPNYKKFSRKLVSSTFKEEVIDTPSDYVRDKTINPSLQAVFQYSKNCFACREYGEYFENLALGNLKLTDSNLMFGRINNDKNQMNCTQNFGFTPVFQVFKAGIKNTPYVYRHQLFTPELLRNFIQITSQFEVIKEEEFQNAQKQFGNVILNL